MCALRTKVRDKDLWVRPGTVLCVRVYTCACVCVELCVFVLCCVYVMSCVLVCVVCACLCRVMCMCVVVLASHDAALMLRRSCFMLCNSIREWFHATVFAHNRKGLRY